MKKQTGYLIIGIGIASVLAGIFGAIRSGEMVDSLSGVLIGVALIGTVIIERAKKKQDRVIIPLIVLAAFENTRTFLDKKMA